MTVHDPLDHLREDMASEWAVELAEITGQLASGNVDPERLERRRELFRLLRTAGGSDERPDRAQSKATCERVRNAKLPEPEERD